ncbi:MAG: TetR/AcrR family transcriptional regulator [Sporichthyaceae bacterium]
MVGPLTDDAPLGPVRDREAFFAAAYQLLAERGSEAVTVGALCQRMHATRGSFYHRFPTLPAFVAAFTERWQQGRMAWAIDCDAVDDPLRRYEKIVNESLEFLFTPGEAAIRAWGSTEPLVGAALAVTHATADAVATRTLEQVVGDPELAALLQICSVCAVIGLSLRAEQAPDPARFLAIAREYARRSVGVETELVEINGRVRFRFLDDVLLPGGLPWTSPDVHVLAWTADEARPPAVVSTGTTRTREDYFRVARELLAERGSDGLTVDALCDRLEVTKGSFRWHFSDMQTFVESLASHWVQCHGTLLAGTVAEPDSALQLATLLQRLLRAPDPAETAFRAWAHAEPTVGEALREIDRRTREAFAATIRAATSDPAADLLADGLLGAAIGLNHLPGVDPDTAARVILVFARTYLRIDARLEVEDDRPRFVVERPG